MTVSLPRELKKEESEKKRKIREAKKRKELKWRQRQIRKKGKKMEEMTEESGRRRAAEDAMEALRKMVATATPTI